MKRIMNKKNYLWLIVFLLFATPYPYQAETGANNGFYFLTLGYILFFSNSTA